jgi:hypothetical protein
LLVEDFDRLERALNGVTLDDIFALNEVTLALELHQLAFESEYLLLVTCDLLLETDYFNG